MQSLKVSILILTLFTACNSQVSRDKNTGTTANAEISLRDSTKYTTIEWLDSANRDFGKIAEGKKLEVAYRFKNTGTLPLVIQRVQPSCGCTIAEQPNEPILPGNEGVIKASFNSEKHVGMNQKSLYVFANTKGTQRYELRFRVEVEKNKW
ncbi:MAG TPA: DUF1573 domain-containing protein [Puia sp.]|nr:DUF1573 domain-containing protein [Puia sp.]